MQNNNNTQQTTNLNKQPSRDNMNRYDGQMKANKVRDLLANIKRFRENNYIQNEESSDFNHK